MIASDPHLIRTSFRAISREKTILNTKEQPALETSLETFLEQLPVRRIAQQVSLRASKPEAEVLALIETFANECAVTLGLVTGNLDKNKRILEVGAGLCLFSLFLKQQGYNVVALEPALGGFGLFEQLKKAILSHYSDLGLLVLDKPAQNLSVAEDGSFDLVFSNNVIEHIPSWHVALNAMISVLKEDGVMVHACPNYSIPYEPHYGVPVFRRLPNLSKKLFLSAKRDPEIWDSLNFITHHEITKYCNSMGLKCEFRRELLYKAISRIDNDKAFRERHKGFVSSVASLIIKSGLGGLIRRIPPALSTPMIVEISSQHKGAR